jgi:hypothetical protein
LASFPRKRESILILLFPRIAAPAISLRCVQCEGLLSSDVKLDSRFRGNDAMVVCLGAKAPTVVCLDAKSPMAVCLSATRVATPIAMIESSSEFRTGLVGPFRARRSER